MVTNFHCYLTWNSLLESLTMKFQFTFRFTRQVQVSGIQGDDVTGQEMLTAETPDTEGSGLPELSPQYRILQQLNWQTGEGCSYTDEDWGGR